MLSRQKEERLMNRAKVTQPERVGTEADSLCVAVLCGNGTHSQNLLKRADFKITRSWVQVPR